MGRSPLPRPAGGRRRRRALGQHFLRNASAADQIVAAFAPRPGEPVLEVGPGRGVLTGRLLEAGARVLAVEKDERLAAALPERAGGAGRLVVAAADALDVDLDALVRPALLESGFGRARVLANLPYAAGTAILARLLMRPDLFASLTVMLQREVAERVCAPPGSRVYGSLSVLAQYFAVPRLVMRLGPGSFDPPPKVHSAVVVLDVRERRGLDPAREAAYPPFVRSLFRHRRRTLPHNLVPAWGSDLAAIAARLGAMGIAPGRRPETLSREECLALFAGGPAAGPGDPAAGLV